MIVSGVSVVKQVVEILGHVPSSSWFERLDSSVGPRDPLREVSGFDPAEVGREVGVRLGVRLPPACRFHPRRYGARVSAHSLAMRFARLRTFVRRSSSSRTICAMSAFAICSSSSQGSSSQRSFSASVASRALAYCAADDLASAPSLLLRISQTKVHAGFPTWVCALTERLSGRAAARGLVRARYAARLGSAAEICPVIASSSSACAQ